MKPLSVDWCFQRNDISKKIHFGILIHFLSWRQQKHQCSCFHYWDYLTNFWRNNWRSLLTFAYIIKRFIQTTYFYITWHAICGKRRKEIQKILYDGHYYPDDQRINQTNKTKKYSWHFWFHEWNTYQRPHVLPIVWKVIVWKEILRKEILL